MDMPAGCIPRLRAGAIFRPFERQMFSLVSRPSAHRLRLVETLHQ